MFVYKACQKSIVTLELLKDSVTNESRPDVVDSNHAKFRTNKVKVVQIKNVKTCESMKSDNSFHDKNFKYSVGKIITEPTFEPDLNQVCGGGIHYFKTRETALSWYHSYYNHYTRPDGLDEWWYENGQLNRRCNYKDGERNGHYECW